MTGITCCKDCIPPKRHYGCHDNCGEYIQQKQDMEERKRDRREWFEKHPIPFFKFTR